MRTGVLAMAALAAAVVAAPPAPATDATFPVELLFTAETGFQPLPCRCRVNPLGGWSQRVAVVDSLRATTPRALLLDAGGWLGGDVTREIADIVAGAHGLMGYDALNVGPEELRSLAGRTPDWLSDLPLVSGHPDRDPAIPAYRIVERDGLRVGIVGAGRFEPGAPTPAEQVGRALAEMPASDVVVVLLAGGLGPVNTIANGHDRVDVVLYGDGARTPTPIGRRGTIAAAPGTRGRYVGRLVLPARGSAPDACDYALVPVRPEFRGMDELVRLALRAAELHDGEEAVRADHFQYVTE
jgi:2',3'-cyclic-nucleotide 2'-phosphodiesterase (5'-nucleotidase family)